MMKDYSFKGKIYISNCQWSHDLRGRGVFYAPTEGKMELTAHLSGADAEFVSRACQDVVPIEADVVLHVPGPSREDELATKVQELEKKLKAAREALK
jgi:hypothetical protein